MWISALAEDASTAAAAPSCGESRPSPVSTPAAAVVLALPLFALAAILLFAAIFLFVATAVIALIPTALISVAALSPGGPALGKQR